MKTYRSSTAFFTCALLLCLVNISCKKTENQDEGKSKEQLIARKWDINRIQLRLYNGSTFVKDTILRNTPKPKNFVTLGSDGSFQYCFNKATSDLGTYAFKGADSIITTSAPTAYRWKLLTLTSQLFTVVSTSSSDPDFPGYNKVERYQTFVPNVK